VSTSRPSLPSDVPERIGRYEILLPIASGGMATVYLARTVGPGGFTTEVALKLTHAHLRENPDFSHDLLEEAKLVARIRHHNVVPVIDVGEDPRGIYLVMEYVEGDSLAGLFRRAGATMPRPIAARFILDALEGLHAAHELRDSSGELLGLVHRDFTPHNILIGTDGVARLADFGIAKAATRLGNTRMGMVKGKIAYMPPEQAKGLTLDRRCDVWAAGVVAWELFSGRRLYIEEDDVSTLLKVATEQPPRLSSVVPGMPESVSAAVAGALTMDLEKRSPTAAAFSKSLGAAVRASGSVAEASEAAEWMMRLVGPTVSERRLAAAEIQARRSQTAMTPAARRQQPEITEQAVTSAKPGRAEPTWLLPVPKTVTRQPTQMLPTRVLPEPEGRPTDAVAVVGHTTTRPFGLTPLRIGLVTAACSAVLVGFVLRLSIGARQKAPALDMAASSAPAADLPVPPPAASSAPASAVPPAIAPAPRITLRVHASAPLAAVAVDGRSVALTPGVTDADLDLGVVDPTTAVTIDAMSTDSRRVAIMIAPSASEATLDFPPLPGAPAARPLSPRPAPPRPAPPRPAPRPTAPLAPSPYP